MQQLREIIKKHFNHYDENDIDYFIHQMNQSPFLVEFEPENKSIIISTQFKNQDKKPIIQIELDFKLKVKPLIEKSHYEFDVYHFIPPEKRQPYDWDTLETCYMEANIGLNPYYNKHCVSLYDQIEKIIAQEKPQYTPYFQYALKAEQEMILPFTEWRFNESLNNIMKRTEEFRICNSHELQRVNNFVELPYFSDLSSTRLLYSSYPSFNSLSDAELLKKVYCLDFFPSRKTIQHLKEMSNFGFNDFFFLQCYTHHHEYFKEYIQFIQNTDKMYLPDSNQGKHCLLKALELKRHYPAIQNPKIKQLEWDKLEIDEIGHCYDYLSEIHCFMPNMPPETIQVQKIVKESKYYHTVADKIQSEIRSLVVKKYPEYDDFLVKDPLEHFHFVNHLPSHIQFINSSQALLDEGGKMNHCVGGLSYLFKAFKGESFIFHLNHGEQQSTLEIIKDEQEKWKINQHYGQENSAVNDSVLKTTAKNIETFFQSLPDKDTNDFIENYCLPESDVNKIEQESQNLSLSEKQFIFGKYAQLKILNQLLNKEQLKGIIKQKFQT